MNVPQQPYSQSPRGETNWMPSNGLKGDQNLIYPYNGILFGHKKEWNTGTG